MLGEPLDLQGSNYLDLKQSTKML